MKCVVIDDDKVSRVLIEKYIGKTDFLEHLISFESAVQALQVINEDSEIDLIFLDIEMPEMSGVEFIQTLNKLPQIIVISAKEKYALEAIEHDVTDYLLKPVTYTRFFKAAGKAYLKHKEEANSSKKTTDGIFIKNSSSTFVRLRYDDIYWIEALENYVVIHTPTEKFTIHFTMKAILEQLPDAKFARVHRSFIVNTTKISMIEDNAVILDMPQEKKSIPIAKSYKDTLLKNINIVSK